MNLTATGLKAKIQFFEDYKNDLKTNIAKEINAWANNTASDAIALAPADEGYLRNSIKPDYGDLSASVVVAADYAAYLEFGTRRFAEQYVGTLPPDWQAFAAQYRGPGGGSFQEFVMRLTQWVLRKGIGATYDVKTHRRVRVGKQSAQTTAEADAYAIAIYIIRNGIQPHPFLFPADQKNRPILISNLEAITGGKLTIT
jgi:HK97 gp10 family phage protein